MTFTALNVRSQDDGDLLIAPFPVWDEGTFYLFYTGNFLTSGICLATSPDGYNYTKFTGNPVLTASGSGFDSLFVSGGVVLKVGSKWVMYYYASHDMSSLWLMGKATSPDGVTRANLYQGNL